MAKTEKARTPAKSKSPTARRGRQVPRSFELHWGSGQIIEEGGGEIQPHFEVMIVQRLHADFLKPAIHFRQVLEQQRTAMIRWSNCYQQLKLI